MHALWRGRGRVGLWVRALSEDAPEEVLDGVLLTAGAARRERARIRAVRLRTKRALSLVDMNHTYDI